jgi:hypothetical protein
MPMPSEEDTIAPDGTAVKGPFAIYLDMIDTHAIENVENIEGGGVPFAHSAWLLLPALILGVFTLSGAPLIVGIVLVGLWTLAGAGYYWRAHRRHRIAAGLPAWSLARYWMQHGRRGLMYGGAWIGLQELFRYYR